VNPIEVERVSKAFDGHQAVADLSFAVRRGLIHGFLGPNGAGKTTTLRMILRIFHPDSGTIRVLGETEAGKVRERVGYLPEERGVYRKMKVGEMLRFFGRLKGMGGADLDRRVDEGLERLRLAEWGRKKVEELSKGMQQKVQFLATLLHDPELLIMDEPFSGLDPVNVELLKDLILEKKREGKTILFSTHQMEQVEKMCDRVLLIHRGRNVLDGDVGEVRRAHGRNTVKLDYEGDGRRLAALPGIERARDYGSQFEAELLPSVDPADFLNEAIRHVRVRRFETAESSMHAIFLKLVGEEAAAPAPQPVGGPARG
jgi:ABC-2 type transport system ATP-binding protein